MQFVKAVFLLQMGLGNPAATRCGTIAKQCLHDAERHLLYSVQPKRQFVVQIGKLSSEDPVEERKQKEIKSLLNKVTPEKFDVIFKKLLDVTGTDNITTLRGLIDQVIQPFFPSLSFAPCTPIFLAWFYFFSSASLFFP